MANMLGQMAFAFQQPQSTKLRHRLKLSLASSAGDVRWIYRKHHYLGRARVGRQLHYLILIDDVVEGAMGFAYPMMSAPLVGVPSDEILEFARLYLKSNIPNSASCAIGRSLRRIKEDWAMLYPDAKPIRMVVSWSDTRRHEGTIYKAANFTWLRRTKGTTNHKDKNVKSRKFGRGTRKNHDDYRNDKDCWIYPLD